MTYRNNPSVTNEGAQLTSPYFGKGIQFCMQFYYFTKVTGNGESYLHLDKWPNQSKVDLSNERLWSLQVGSSDGWNSATVPVYQTDEPFQLQFSVQWSTNHTGTVAIDDLRVEKLNPEICLSKLCTL